MHCKVPFFLNLVDPQRNTAFSVKRRQCLVSDMGKVLSLTHVVKLIPASEEAYNERPVLKPELLFVRFSQPYFTAQLANMST